MNKYYQLAGLDVNGGQILWREQYYPEYAEMLFLLPNQNFILPLLAAATL